MSRTANSALRHISGPTTGINKKHVIKMALVHDLAECIVGDLTPHCGVSKAEKHAREEVRGCTQ